MLLRALNAAHAAAHRHLPPGLRQFVKFGIVGGIGFIVDFSVYLTLSRGVGWRTVFEIFGYQFIAPNLVSVLSAMVVVFCLNKFWTFRDPRTTELARQGVRFFLFYAFTYVLNQVVTSFFAFQLPVLQTLFGSNADLVAKVIAIAFVTLVNFGGNKLVVFRGVKAAPDEYHA